MTVVGGNPYQKLALILVLLALCIQVMRRWQAVAFSEKLVEFSLPASSLVISVIGYGYYFGHGDAQWLIDAGSHLILCFLIVILLGLTPRGRQIEITSLFFVALCVVIVLSVAVSIYEISYARAWAVYARADGVIVSRASGLHFNPNLFGVWLGFSFLLLLRLHRSVSLDHVKWFVYLLIGVGLFLSGSRGAIVSLAICGLITVMLHWRGLLITVRPYLVVALGFCLAFGWSLSAHEGPFNALALRWLDLPLVLMGVLLPPELVVAFSDLLAKLAGVPTGSLATLGSIAEAENFEVAMSGRFSGTLRDNGFLGALDAGGPLAAAGAAWLFGGLAILIYKASYRAPVELRIQMWTLFTYIMLWSLQARSFQVYPIWVYVALAVVILLRDVTSTGVRRTSPPIR